MREPCRAASAAAYHYRDTFRPRRGVFKHLARTRDAGFNVCLFCEFKGFFWVTREVYMAG